MHDNLTLLLLQNLLELGQLLLMLDALSMILLVELNPIPFKRPNQVLILGLSLLELSVLIHQKANPLLLEKSTVDQLGLPLLVLFELLP